MSDHEANKERNEVSPTWRLRGWCLALTILNYLALRGRSGVDWGGLRLLGCWGYL